MVRREIPNQRHKCAAPTAVPNRIASASTAPQVIDRVARIGDGWFPFFNPHLASQIAEIHKKATSLGRSVDDIGIESILPLGGMGQSELDRIKSCAEMGVTHLSFVTMSQGFKNVDEHIDAIKRNWDNVVGKYA